MKKNIIIILLTAITSLYSNQINESNNEKVKEIANNIETPFFYKENKL